MIRAIFNRGKSGPRAKRLRYRYVAVIGLVAATIGGSVAWATVGGLTGADGTYTACVANRDGSIRIVTPGGSCSSRETPVSLANGSEDTHYLAATGTAADSNKLDGLDSTDFKVGCASGFLFQAGMCWQVQDSCCFTLAQASAHCGSLGGRLPLYSEVVSFWTTIGLPPGGGDVYSDWTASSVDDGDSIYIDNVTSDDMDGVRPNSTASYARCVVPPVNALGTP